LAATINARWVCEQVHQQLKEELGLDHFEGRSWQGLLRHALMAKIAYAFPEYLCLAAVSGEGVSAGLLNGRCRLSEEPSSPPRPASALRMTTLPQASPQTALLKAPK